MKSTDFTKKINDIAKVHTEDGLVDFNGIGKILSETVDQVIRLSRNLEKLTGTVEGLIVHINNLPQEGDKQGIISSGG